MLLPSLIIYSNIWSLLRLLLYWYYSIFLQYYCLFYTNTRTLTTSVAELLALRALNEEVPCSSLGRSRCTKRPVNKMYNKLDKWDKFKVNKSLRTCNQRREISKEKLVSFKYWYSLQKRRKAVRTGMIKRWWSGCHRYMQKSWTKPIASYSTVSRVWRAGQLVGCHWQLHTSLRDIVLPSLTIWRIYKKSKFCSLLVSESSATGHKRHACP